MRLNHGDVHSSIGDSPQNCIPGVPSLHSLQATLMAGAAPFRSNWCCLCKPGKSCNFLGSQSLISCKSFSPPARMDVSIPRN